jgi:restriction endonuclease Mrr
VKVALLAALRTSPEPLRAAEAAALVADQLDLTADERAMPRSSGKRSKWDNEVQWAFQDLKHDGLARGVRPGLWMASR